MDRGVGVRWTVCSRRSSLLIAALVAGDGCSKSDLGLSDLAAGDLAVASAVDLAVTPPRLLTGFSVPIAIAWDSGSSAWYVSNRLVAPAGVPVKSGAAYLSRIPADLSSVETMWLGGLNAPAGLAALGGKLYLADANEVAVVDIASKAVQKRTAVAGVAAYLSGLALDSLGGKAYVSDSVGNQIFSYNLGSGATALFVKSSSLASPQGLYVRGGSLTALSYGSGSGDGPIWSIDLQTAGLVTLGSFRGSLVGLSFDPGNVCYLIGDQPISFVSRVDTSGGRSVTARNFAVDGLKSVAGLDFDPQRGQLGVTDPVGNRVAFFNLPPRDPFW